MSTEYESFFAVPPDEAPTMTEPEAQATVDQLQRKPGRYYGKLQEFYGFIGMLVFPFDQVCGAAVLQNAEKTARSLDRLAGEYKAVARIVERMTSTTAVGLFLGAHAEIAYTILQHHAPDALRDAFKQGFRPPWMMQPEPEPEMNGDRG
jgi:hypothetical protein